MRFKPLSEKELSEANLISPGQYQFEVIEAQDMKSQAGNDMIVLKLKIWDMEGRERIIYDRLLEAMAFKLRHYCEATNLIHKYESGTLSPEDCIGKSGALELIIQQDKKGLYPDKNSVKDYIVKANHNEPKKTVDDDFFKDEIPF